MPKSKTKKKPETMATSKEMQQQALIKAGLIPLPIPPICSSEEYLIVEDSIRRLIESKFAVRSITLRKISAVVDHLIVKQQRGEWP